ncbi:DUF6894 family protein [Methylobacterium sp. CM6257]|jgi:hypothetical protein
MPRYFFDVQSKSGLVCRDYQGLDCPDDEAARSLALHGAGFTSRSDCVRNPQLTSYQFAVADAGHQPLFTVPFSELLADDEQPKTARRRRARPSSSRSRSDKHV